MAGGDRNQSSVLRISNEKLLLLVELHKQHECLWNTSLEDYPHKYQRKRAAADIADKLDVDGFTAHHVMVKFKNLRSSYCQELRRIAETEALVEKGISARVHKPTVCWFSAMDSFIRPYLRLKREDPYKRKCKAAASEQDDRGKPERKVKDNSDLIMNKTTKKITIASSEIEPSKILQPASPKEHFSKINSSDHKMEECIEKYTLIIKEEPIEEDDQDMQNDQDEQDDQVMPKHQGEQDVQVKQEDQSEQDDQVMPEHQGEQDVQVKQEDQSEQDDQVHSSSADYLIANESDFHDCFGKYVSSLLSKMPPQKAVLLQPKILSLIYAHLEEN